MNEWTMNERAMSERAMSERVGDDSLGREIARRALVLSHEKQEAEERSLYRKDLLDVLGELTGLTTPELEQIAGGVIASRRNTGAGFFSVKNQILFAALMVFTALGVPALLIWLI